MEILRFEDQAPKAPNRKKSSRGLLVTGLIATLFGISSAFASSTITINTDNKVNLGQGVVTVSGCDSNIGFKPETALNDSATAFKVTDFIIGFDYDPLSVDPDGTHVGRVNSKDCEGKQIKITLYKDILGSATKVNCWTTYDGSYSDGKALIDSNKVIVGAGDYANIDLLSAKVSFKCSSDGSFYYNVSQFGSRSPSFVRSNHNEVTKIYWPDQTGFFFNANAFDHVTIESVSDEPGLTS